MHATLKQFSEQLSSKQLIQLLNSPVFMIWLVRVINVLVMVLLASVLAKLTWMVVTPADNVAKTATNQSAAVSVEPAARLDTISNLHLFGKAEESPVLDAPIVAPETRLQLKLKGVFASSDPERAFAIISDNKNEDKAYRLGSKVSGGAILHAVYVDRVILKRNGRLETLRMEKTYDSTSRKNTYKRQPVTQSKASTRKVKATQKIRQLKQTLQKDPQKVWQQVTISPVLKNGSIKGYTVEHQDKQLMRSLTLKKGDVITAVNGQPLSDPSVLYGLMNQLTSKKKIDVTVERNGQLQTIQLQL